MNKHMIEIGQLLHGDSKFCSSGFCGSKLLAALLAAALLTSVPLNAADTKAQTQKKATTSAKKIVRPIPTSTEIVPSLELSVGQSHLIRLPASSSLKRVKVDDDKIVQVDVTSPRELLLHAKTLGTAVVLILDKSGQTAVMDVRVVGTTTAMDAQT